MKGGSDGSTPATPASRRRWLIRLAAAGLVGAPLVRGLPGSVAQAAELLAESDPQATALHYRPDASRAPERRDHAEFCDTCQLFTGKPGQPNGSCELFPGKLVSAKGWCSKWEGL